MSGKSSAADADTSSLRLGLGLLERQQYQAPHLLGDLMRASDHKAQDRKVGGGLG